MPVMCFAPDLWSSPWTQSHLQGKLNASVVFAAATHLWEWPVWPIEFVHS